LPDAGLFGFRGSGAGLLQDMLPQEMRDKLQPDALSQLDELCRKYSEFGQVLTVEKIPNKLMRQIQEAGFSVRGVFRHMGITFARDKKS
jgi:predicted ATPase